jgi:hypothetical protein
MTPKRLMSMNEPAVASDVLEGASGKPEVKCNPPSLRVEGHRHSWRSFVRAAAPNGNTGQLMSDVFRAC